MTRHGPDYDVGMIRHHHPRSQLVTLSLKKANCGCNKVRPIRIAQITNPVPGIEVLVHTMRILAKQFLLFMPGKRAIYRQSLPQYDLTFLFKLQENFLRQGSGLPECDEIRSAFTL